MNDKTKIRISDEEIRLQLLPGSANPLDIVREIKQNRERTIGSIDNINLLIQLHDYIKTHMEGVHVTPNMCVIVDLALVAIKNRINELE